MSASLIPQKQLEIYKSKEEIIKLTAAQIKKDFNQFGLDITFSGIMQYAYNELFKQLRIHIIDLLNTNTQKLYSLLYQIDLSEHKIRNIYSKNPEKELSEIISSLILNRELKKVATRVYFKENPDALNKL